jgi:hypothetical protein
MPSVVSNLNRVVNVDVDDVCAGELIATTARNRKMAQPFFQPYSLVIGSPF